MIFRRLILFSFITSCATYTDDSREVRDLYRSAQFDKAYEKAAQADYLKKSNNRLLARLEKSMILDRRADYKESRKLLLEADSIADELYTESISKGALSFVYNDSALDYSGEDYEKVAIHTILALSFISTGQFKETAVEARKINSKINEINSKYDEAKNRYAEDAFARYLAGLVHEMQRDWDSAIIDYNKSVQMYQGFYSQFIDGDTPEDLINRLHRLLNFRNRKEKVKELEKQFPKVKFDKTGETNSGQIVVIFDSGTISPKEAKDFFIPVAGQIVRLSWPSIDKQHLSNNNFGFSASLGGAEKYYPASNVANMNKIAHWSLEDKRTRMILKTGARLLAKTVLTQQAYDHLGPLGGLAANAYSAISETADTRSWSLLPEGFFIATGYVKPGTYQVKFHSAGRLSRIETVEVKANQLVMLRAEH